MDTEIHGTLGALSELMVAAAQDDWISEYRAGRDADTVWANDVVATHYSLQLKHGGRATAQVTIIALPSWKCSNAFFRLARNGSNEWKITHSTLNLE